jgi:hypothetical protein
MQHLAEAQKIWDEYVPKSGQADTVQGELLRAVEKLRDEATRNGNGNWDAGFEILLRYLLDHLLNEAVFSRDTIAETKKIIERLKDFRRPVLEDEPYDTLGDRVVDYYRHFGSQPHVKNTKLRR